MSTATCGDRDLSAPPFQGRLTGQGPGAGWKPRGTLNACGHRALSLPPSRTVNRTSVRRGLEDRWCPPGHGDQDLGCPPILARPWMYRRAGREMKSPTPLLRGQAPGADEPHELVPKGKVGSIRTSANSSGRYARGQSSGAVNAVPSGFGGSNPSPAHHATMARRQSSARQAEEVRS